MTNHTDENSGFRPRFETGGDAMIKIIDFLKQLKREIRYQTPDLIERKSRDVVTSIDKFLHSRLQSFLKENYRFPVLSEESEIKLDFMKQKSYYWVVDPLDGTVNYFHSIPVSCVSVALWREQNPVMGVVLDLNRDEVFIGITERCEITDETGAWLNNRPIRVSSVARKDLGVVSTGFPSGENTNTRSLDKILGSWQDWQKVRLIGSAALSLAWVGCGRMDAYIEDGIHIWDVAAGMAIVKAAGGNIVLQSCQQKNRVFLMASNGMIPVEDMQP
jgi:myo-inositol-1(or 4)-monophosphatase